MDLTTIDSIHEHFDMTNEPPASDDDDDKWISTEQQLLQTTTDNNWTDEPISTTYMDDHPQTTPEIEATTTNEDSITTLEPIRSESSVRASDGSQLRPPKIVDKIFMIYPSEMSGIPKTTPKNMPASNEMKMYDEIMGEKLHLIFATNMTDSTVDGSTEQTIIFTTTVPTMIDTTVSPPPEKLTKLKVDDRKKRRRYRPNRGRTSSATETIEIEEKHVRNGTFTPKKTGKIPANRSTTQARIRSPPQHHTSTIDPNNNDKTRSNSYRYRLFNSGNRLNFLRKTKEDATTTTTTEAITITSTTSANTSEEQLLSASTLDGVNQSMAVQPNRQFMSRIDNDHKYMIESMRLVLMTTMTSSSDPATSRVVEHPPQPTPQRTRKVNHRSSRRRMENDEQLLLVNTLNNTNRKITDRGQKRFKSRDINKSYLASLTTPLPIVETGANPTAINLRSKHRIRTNVRKLPSTDEISSTTTEQSESSLETTTEIKNYVQDISNITTVKIEMPFMEQNISTFEDGNKTEKKTVKFYNRRNPHILKNKVTTTIKRIKVDTDEISTEPSTTETVEEISTISKTLPLPQRLEPEALIADFRPSPLWSLSDIPGHLTEISAIIDDTRESRTFRGPRQLINGFVPIVMDNVHAQNIVGLIPKAYRTPTLNQVRYELPKSENSQFQRT